MCLFRNFWTICWQELRERLLLGEVVSVRTSLFWVSLIWETKSHQSLATRESQDLVMMMSKKWKLWVKREFEIWEEELTHSLVSLMRFFRDVLLAEQHPLSTHVVVLNRHVQLFPRRHFHVHGKETWKEMTNTFVVGLVRERRHSRRCGSFLHCLPCNSRGTCVGERETFLPSCAVVVIEQTLLFPSACERRQEGLSNSHRDRPGISSFLWWFKQPCPWSPVTC